MEKFSKVTLALAVSLITLCVGGVAYADTIPANPMGTNTIDGRDDTIAWVMTYGVPALAGAMLFGALIRAGFRWYRRVTTRAAG